MIPTQRGIAAGDGVVDAHRHAAGRTEAHRNGDRARCLSGGLSGRGEGDVRHTDPDIIVENGEDVIDSGPESCAKGVLEPDDEVVVGFVQYVVMDVEGDVLRLLTDAELKDAGHEIVVDALAQSGGHRGGSATELQRTVSL